MQTKTKVIGLVGIVMTGLASLALLNRGPMQEPKRENYNGPATVVGLNGHLVVYDFDKDGKADAVVDMNRAGTPICVAPEFQDRYPHPLVKQMPPELRKMLSDEIRLENEIDYQLSNEYYKQKTGGKSTD